jgi:hypothetical protein
MFLKHQSSRIMGVLYRSVKINFILLYSQNRKKNERTNIRKVTGLLLFITSYKAFSNSGSFLFFFFCKYCN